MSRTAPGFVMTFILPLVPAPLAAQSVIAIEADVLGEIARLEALRNAGSIRRSAECETAPDEDEIVVCAPGRSPGFRVPYRPVAGAPPVRAMGEVPRAVASIDDCHRLCDRGVWIRIDVGQFLSDPGGAIRGIFRGR